MIKPISVSFMKFQGTKTTNIPAGITPGTDIRSLQIYLDWLDPFESNLGSTNAQFWFHFTQSTVLAGTDVPAVVDSANFERFSAVGNLRGRNRWTFSFTDLQGKTPQILALAEIQILCQLFKLQDGEINLEYSIFPNMGNTTGFKLL